MKHTAHPPKITRCAFALLLFAVGILAQPCSQLRAQTFSEIDSFTDGVGGSGTGILGSNTFTFAATDGGRIANTSVNNSSSAFLNQANFSEIDPAFQGIIFNPSPWGYGRADATAPGAFTGNTFTITFATPQSDLLMLVSYLDGNWGISEAYTILPSFNTLAVNGSNELYSTIYDGSIPSFNQGRGVLAFTNPVSIVTFTKNGGPADDFFFAMATVPEPSSAVLFGLGAIFCMKRRRK